MSNIYLAYQIAIFFLLCIQTAFSLTGWTEVITMISPTFPLAQITIENIAGGSMCLAGVATYSSETLLGGIDCFGNNAGVETSIKFPLLSVSSPVKIKFQAKIYGYRDWITIYDTDQKIRIKELVDSNVFEFDFSQYIVSIVDDYCIFLDLEYVIDQTGGSMQFEITQTGTSADFSLQSWGVSDIRISTHPCKKGCSICVSYGVCSTCDPGFFWVGIYCEASCPVRYYGNASNDNTCEPCDLSCSTCSGPAANQCLTCFGSLTLDPITQLCSCPQQYQNYVEPNCFACLESCETCDSATTCSACTSSKNRSLVGTACECNPGYFERSLSLTYDNTLTRGDYTTTLYGACIECPSKCLKCTNEKTCTQCVNDTLEVQNGVCVCKSEYVENSRTGNCEKASTGIELAQALNEQATVIEDVINNFVYTVFEFLQLLATGTVAVALPSILLGNPAVALQSMAIIQVLKYNLFINVKYPQIVEEFFALFEQADGSALAKVFVDFETQKMRSSYGFHVHDVDSMFLRNSFQNIQSVCVLALAYICIKFIIINFIKKSPSIQKVNNALSGSKQEEKPLNACEIESVRRARILSREKGIDAKVAEQNQIDQITALNIENNKIINKILTKVTETFEWGLFLGTIEAGFLNLCTFSFLQLQNASVTSIPQLISFLIAFLISGLLVLFVLSMYFIVQKIHESSKTISLISPINNEKSTIFPLRDTHEKTLSIDEKLTERKIGIEEQIMKSFQMVHMLFVPGKILKQGFYLVVVIRKLIYSIFLVFAYKYPQIVLSVFITLNSSMIFILIKYKPYKESIYCIRDILTELFLCILHILTFPLTNSDFVSDSSNSEQYSLLGTYMFFTIGAIIIAQLICIVHDSLMQIINAIRKEPPIPETPIIPETPSLSRMEEKEVNRPLNNSSSETSMTFRKKGTQTGFEEDHQSVMNNKLVSTNIKVGLQHLYEQIKANKQNKELNQQKLEYEKTLFLTNVALSLNKLSKSSPENSNTSIEIMPNIQAKSQGTLMIDLFENSPNISMNQTSNNLNKQKSHSNLKQLPDFEQSSLNSSPKKQFSRNSSVSQISLASLNEKSKLNSILQMQQQQQNQEQYASNSPQEFNQSNSTKMGVSVKSANSSLSNSRAASSTNLNNLLPVSNSNLSSVNAQQNGADSSRRIYRFDLQSVMEEEMNRVYQKNIELSTQARKKRQSRLLNIIQSK